MKSMTRKIDFSRNSIAQSTAHYFLILVYLIFTRFIIIKIFETIFEKILSLFKVSLGQNFIKKSVYSKLKVNALHRDHPPALELNKPFPLC